MNEHCEQQFHYNPHQTAQHHISKHLTHISRTSESQTSKTHLLREHEQNHSELRGGPLFPHSFNTYNTNSLMANPSL